jgi:hypothetical protein
MHREMDLDGAMVDYGNHVTHIFLDHHEKCTSYSAFRICCSIQVQASWEVSMGSGYCCPVLDKIASGFQEAIFALKLFVKLTLTFSNYTAIQSSS